MNLTAHFLSRIAPALLTLCALAGCAFPGSIVPNTTQADEVLKKLGKPTATRTNPQGGEYWDYAYGPEGSQTWRFGIDGGRTVRSAEQLLTHERLYKVVPGTTTEAQVTELLGKPGKITRLNMGPVWEWRVDLRPNRGHFVVNFDHKGVATGIAVLMDVTTDTNARGDR